MVSDFIALQGNSSNIKVWGHVAWYSIPESANVKAYDLLQLAGKHRIPMQYLPDSISKADAFRKATAEAIPSKKVQIVKLDEKVNDSEQIIRTFEVPSSRDIDTELLRMDTENKVYANQDHVGTAVFDRKAETVTVHSINPQYNSLMQNVMQNYEMYSEYYTGDAIRRMTKNFLRKMGAISMRKAGGVEFIPVANNDLLVRFAAMLNELSSDCDISTIPLIPRNSIEEEQQRILIEKNLMTDVASSVGEVAKLLGGDPKSISAKRTVKELIGEFRELLKDNQWTQKKIDNVVERFQEQKNLIAQYKDLLQVNMDEIENDMELLQRQAMTIVAKVVER